MQENGNGKAQFDVNKLTVFSVIVNDNISAKTTTKTSTKTNTKTSTKTNAKTNAIVAAIKANPDIQLKELAALFEISTEGVRWHLTKLKKEGVIKREGSSRKGKWIIIK